MSDRSSARSLLLLCFALGACRVCPPRASLPGTPCAPDAGCAEQGPRDELLISRIEEGPAPFEMSPWFQGGGGLRRAGGQIDGILSLAGGVEGTFRLGAAGDCATDGTCLTLRPRIGAWGGFESTFGPWRGEGGMALSLAGSRVTSWPAFGVRAGGGRGSTGATHIVVQASWGTRFVPMRRRYLDEARWCPATVAPASGLQLFVAVRQELDRDQRFDLTVGLEWQPFGPGLGILAKNFLW